LTSIDAALADREFDEIVLSTLPPGLSRWLSHDLPNCVRRARRFP
jgi:cell pole-organizing protein PopZ